MIDWIFLCSMCVLIRTFNHKWWHFRYLTVDVVSYEHECVLVRRTDWDSRLWMACGSRVLRRRFEFSFGIHACIRRHARRTATHLKSSKRAKIHLHQTYELDVLFVRWTTLRTMGSAADMAGRMMQNPKGIGGGLGWVRDGRQLSWVRICRLVAGVAGLAYVGYNSLFSVDGGHRAIMFNRITGVQSDIFREGLHFRVPWFQYPIIYDIRARPNQIRSPTGTKGEHTRTNSNANTYVHRSTNGQHWLACAVSSRLGTIAAHLPHTRHELGGTCVAQYLQWGSYCVPTHGALPKYKFRCSNQLWPNSTLRNWLHNVNKCRYWCANSWWNAHRISTLC